jgi:phosphoribosyl 1,2-cyclic phosphate phosphodiesterase
MQICLLGTAAAEGWPAPFCVCEACEEARKRGGANLRTRSGALIDDDLKIDFCPDTLVQMQRTGRHLANIKTLVFTHQHSDHVAPPELSWAFRPYSATPPEKIDVYAPAPVIEKLDNAFSSHAHKDQFAAAFELHLLTPHEPVTTAQGDRILALPADHVAGATVLVITRGDKTIFYGHDSGLYPEETLDGLEKNGAVDMALMDCTSGSLVQYNRGHMSVSGVEQMRDELKKRGVITEKTRVVATHFSHNGKWLHEELMAHFTPRNIDVAYDGMTLEV